MKNFKMLSLSVLSMLFIFGCGREMELKAPAKSPVRLNENMEALSVDTAEFSSFATTFSMFFIPEENDLTWESSLYSRSDKYEDKISKIMSHIIKNSDEFDLYDQKIVALDLVKKPLTEKYEELGCDFDYTEECGLIDTQLKEITTGASVRLRSVDGTEKRVDYEGYKSYLIEEIQSSVDEYNRLQPNLNRPKNWMLYGDAPVYEIRQLEDKTFQITFPNLGPFGAQNMYSTETGEIYDVSLGPSLYNAKVELLTFKIKEKGADGNFTSNIWEFTLEKSYVVGKLRYKGDVLKVDSVGKVLRRGVCKIDLAPKGS
jgi:hypothetical protein